MKNLIIAILCYAISIFVGFYWISYDHYDSLVLSALAVTTLGYLVLGLIFTYKYVRWRKTSSTNYSKNTGHYNALVHGDK